MTRSRVWLAIAPAFALLLYWRAPFSWFTNDDFAWLGLPLELNQGLAHVFFHPAAQGTVRFLGDRLYFLAFAELFHFNALPFHLFAMATWCGCLILAALIGERLTNSRTAGALAAIFWTASSVVVKPVVWASAYNEVLCAFCILLAFYARLRSKRVLEWIAYLAGFGALETIVVYPAIAALYALCAGRKQFRSTLPLFVPAIVFAALHFLLIRNTSPFYVLSFDRRIPGTLLQYFEWTLGPSRLYDLTLHGGRLGIWLMWMIAAALGLFVIVRLIRREWIALFFCGWFLLLIAPVLPLPNHVIDYYATLPVLGLAWLGGWAVVAAWRAGWVPRVFGVLCAAGFVAGSTLEVDAYTRWHYQRSVRMRALFMGVEDALREHPTSTLILQNIDNALFQTGFEDEPFRLLGVHKVYLAPGDETKISAREDLGGISPYRISLRQAFTILNQGDARALRYERDSVRDVTDPYRIALKADPRATRVASVDAGDPSAANLLGDGWYAAENGFRWMQKTGTLKLSGPTSRAERLFVSGYAPKAVLADGPVTMTVFADSVRLGAATVRTPDARFAFDFALPAELIGRQMIEVRVQLDKALRSPGDVRELGMIFGTFAIRE
jgi:hypothetical protein